MLREAICTLLFPALVLAPVFQKTMREVSGKEVSSIKSTGMKTASDLADLLPLSQAPAPFGRYTENINGVLLELVRIPQGTFLMGNDRSPNPEEKPAHQVSIRSFYIGQYEITRQQWNIVATTLPQINRLLHQQYIGPVQAGAGFYGETTPADELSWNEAVEFCDRLTRYTGKKYRLPSEAEWEYACRAGTQTEYSFGDQFDPALANLALVSDFLLPAGRPGYANNWGLYEMHGNAAEWCLDNEHASYIGAPSDGSARTQSGDEYSKVLRGGRYRFKAEAGRSAARAFYTKSLVVTGFGLRVVAEITPPISNGTVAATSAASYAGAPLASESIAALFGSTLSTGIQTASALPLPTTLAGTSVVIKDSGGHEYLAPLFFVSPNQINCQLSPGLAPGPGMVSVVANGNIHSTGTIEIISISPGLFTADASGKGLAAALVLRVKSNGEQVYEPVARFDSAANQFVAAPVDLSNPAEEVFLILFGTGIRKRSAMESVRAQLGGEPAEILFAGAQGKFMGLDQVNLRLPRTLIGRGEVTIALEVDGKTANPIKVHFR